MKIEIKLIHMRLAAFIIGTLAALAVIVFAMPSSAYAADMYRMYNPNSGEHFYTASVQERNNLYILGWDYEGVGWYGTGYGRADSMPADVVRPAPNPQSPSITDTVYITPTGKSYHRASCASTKNSQLTAISLSDAISRGYSACKVCKPTGY